MEHDSAKPDGDVVDSSLQMVRDGSAYIGVISHKYGQIPECAKRNPDGLSLTELEFNEARGSDSRRAHQEVHPPKNAAYNPKNHG